MTQLAAQVRTVPSRSRPVVGSWILVRNTGWLCVGAAVLLSVLGVVTIGTVDRPGEPNYTLHQLAHLCVGLIAAAAVVVPHYRVAQRLSYPLLAVVLLMLVFVLIPWVPEAIVRPRNGARRWISVFITDFQPSELAKIAYVLALASYLRFRSNYRCLRGLLLPLALTFIPLGLILIEPDLGTAMLFLPTLFAMLIAAGARLRHVALIIVLGLALAPVARSGAGPAPGRHMLARGREAVRRRVANSRRRHRSPRRPRRRRRSGG